MLACFSFAFDPGLDAKGSEADEEMLAIFLEGMVMTVDDDRITVMPRAKILDF